MLLLDSLFNECCFKGCSMGLKVHITENNPLVSYILGSCKFDPLKIQNCPKYWGVATPGCPKHRGVVLLLDLAQDRDYRIRNSHCKYKCGSLHVPNFESYSCPVKRQCNEIFYPWFFSFKQWPIGESLE